MEDKKLFYVEFGEPRVRMSLSFSFNPIQPVFVVATDYNQAAEKALAYIEYKRSLEPRKGVLTSDGSLNRHMDEEPEEVKIRSVSIASEDVVW